MSLKMTPGKKNKKSHMDPRRLNLDEEAQHFRSGNKKGKQRDASTIAVVNPRMLPPSSNSCYSSFQPVYSLGYPPPMPYVSTMTPYVPPPIVRSYPYQTTRWNAMVAPVQTPIYSVPVPAVSVAAIPVPFYSPVGPQLCSYGTLLTPPIIAEPSMHVFSPIAATVAPPEQIFNFETAFCEQASIQTTVVAGTSYKNPVDEMIKKLKTSPVLSSKQCKRLDPGDYLQLPKSLFPPARSLVVDPNPIIDQFCRVIDCDNHSPWILDLEFGVPRQPVTRPIATYDVQFNSIHCKNTPGAIHPGFESCNKEFKRVFLFYYDFAISNWYRGFVIMNSDRSVANFQTWLQVPMQIFGMCWP